MAHEASALAGGGDAFAVMACAVPAAGQGRSRRFEVFAGGGVSRMGGDEGSLGTGPSVLGGFGFRVTPRLSVEVDLTRAQHERSIAGGPLEGTASGVFGDLLYHFGEGQDAGLRHRKRWRAQF